MRFCRTATLLALAAAAVAGVSGCYVDQTYVVSAADVARVNALPWAEHAESAVAARRADGKRVFLRTPALDGAIERTPLDGAHLRVHTRVVDSRRVTGGVLLAVGGALAIGAIAIFASSQAQYESCEAAQGPNSFLDLCGLDTVIGDIIGGALAAAGVTHLIVGSALSITPARRLPQESDIVPIEPHSSALLAQPPAHVAAVGLAF